jgi:methylenetetrahydrofolate dehydrogenase (NADP+) / methenyltetrahydrofolate cyclohydrolase
MSAQRIDGTAVARSIRARIAARAAALARQGTQPALAVLVVGDDPASRVYVRNKIAACAEAGIRSAAERFAVGAAPETLLARIAALNADPTVHGILVQLPLPPHFDLAAVIAAIAPEKDVDGFKGAFTPCTPQGVIALLDAVGVPIAGRHAVVVGRSHIVGRPVAQLLVERDATVTVCHSRTKDLAHFTRQADILVVAAGRPRLIGADMVKPGAAVIDVGIHRRPDGALVGDVDFDAVSAVAGHITPVPGGVGPMTVAMLLENTLRAAERATISRPERTAAHV